MSIWTVPFWKALSERAVSTAAQGALLGVGEAVLTNGGVDALAVDWLRVLSFAAGGFVLAVLKGLIANGLLGDGPGLSSAEAVTADPKVEEGDAPADAPEDATAYIDAEAAPAETLAQPPDLDASHLWVSEPDTGYVGRHRS